MLKFWTDEPEDNISIEERAKQLAELAEKGISVEDVKEPILVTNENKFVGMRVKRYGDDWIKGRGNCTNNYDDSGKSIGTIIDATYNDGKDDYSKSWTQVRWDKDGITGWYVTDKLGSITSGQLIPYTYNQLQAADIQPVIKEDIIVTKDLAVVGTRVRRGRDWVWPNQDVVNGKQVIGTITNTQRYNDWVEVRWDGGTAFDYRVGNDNYFDLYIATESSFLIKNS